MSTTVEYVEYVRERLPDCGEVSCRKMFGEYMVYINGKPVLTVCDNTVFVKKLPQLHDLMDNAATGYSYEGAKEQYILDMDRTALVGQVIAILEDITPPPAKRKKG